MGKRGFKVLAVDDEQLMLKFYRDYFGSRSLPIETVSNFDDALSVLEKTPIDVIILDLILPGGDGRQALAVLRRRYPAIKVIFVTACNEKQVDDELLQLGAQAVLHKPCTMRAVFECAEKAAMTT